MIKFIFFGLFQTIVLTIYAQNVWKVTSPPYQRSSNPQLAIHSVERTEQYTIIEMTYATGKKDSVYLEICNTFHLRSGGRKVASFIKAEGAPIEDMHHKIFECEPKPKGRFVPSETRAHFKVYFEPLPLNLKTIDLIEYDGKELCEFDVINIQLLLDNPIPPAPPETPKVPLPAGEARPVTVQNETVVHQEYIEIEIWDNDREDGDVLSLSLNKIWLLQGFELAKSKKRLRLQLKRGENWLVMKAENLGSIPPNTAAIAIIEGDRRKVFVLNADKNFSEALKITWL